MARRANGRAREGDEAKKLGLLERLEQALHLGTGDMPWAWVELQLCRYVYHCSRRELWEMDADEVMLDLQMLGVKVKVDELHR